MPTSPCYIPFSTNVLHRPFWNSLRTGSFWGPPQASYRSSIPGGRSLTSIPTSTVLFPGVGSPGTESSGSAGRGSLFPQKFLPLNSVGNSFPPLTPFTRLENFLFHLPAPGCRIPLPGHGLRTLSTAPHGALISGRPSMVWAMPLNTLAGMPTVSPSRMPGSKRSRQIPSPLPQRITKIILPSRR